MSKILPTGVITGLLLAVVLSGCGSSSPKALSRTGSGASSAKATSTVATTTKSTTTLHTAQKQVGSRSETIIVTAANQPVYLLTGDSPKHPQCEASACLNVWPSITATHPTDTGIHGTLAVWHHNGINEVTLNGHPLYTYIGDTSTGPATGEGIATFGGVWYVLSADGAELK